MKKVSTLLFAILFAIPTFAQEKSNVSTEKNVLKINTLSLIVGTGSVFYEHKFSDMISGQLGCAYLGYKMSDIKFSGLILTPEVRIYPKKNAIDGFYIAPYLRYFNLSASQDNLSGSLTVMGGGLLFGRQWITNSGFTMDLFFGGHYGAASVKASDGDTSWIKSNLFSGFRTRMGFALGFAF